MFSVLMSVYRGTSLNHLFQSIDSIGKQTLLPNEVIIVQDGPLEFELDLVLSNYNNLNFVVIRNECNLGLPISLNKGLKLCSNDIIFRVDADDINHIDRFKIQFKAITSNSRLAILGSNVTLIDNASELINHSKFVPLKQEDIKKIIAYKNPFNHPSVVYRKSFLIQVGLYDDLHLYEDWYLWHKLINLKNVEYCNLEENLVYYRIRDFKDRKGFKIVKAEYKFYMLLYKKKYINIIQLIVNLMLKTTIRLLPEFIYLKIKRQSDLIN